MKVVLDTNVFVSGLFFSGPPYEILSAWRDGRLQLVVSAEILDEYRRVGERLELGYSGTAIAAGSPPWRGRAGSGSGRTCVR